MENKNDIAIEIIRAQKEFDNKMEEKDDKKLNFPQGIFGEPAAITGQKKIRNPNYDGQLRIDNEVFRDYLDKRLLQGHKYTYLDKFKQKKNHRKLTFLVVERKE